MPIADYFKTFFYKLGIGETRCFHCKKPFFPSSDNKSLEFNLFCTDCQKQIYPYRGHFCRLCGSPVSDINFSANKQFICPDCRVSPPPWNGFAYYGLYSGILKDLLLRFKFDGNIYLARLFAEILLQVSACLPKPDVITAIPQHPAHLLKRGYNQAYEIGKSFSKLSGYKLINDLLLKTKQTRPQEHLSKKERLQNLSGVFFANKKVTKLRIWLIDDILTTGATCMEAAKILLEAGAAEVYLLYIARTQLKG